MKKYSIIPLFVDHADEICQDIERQYDEDIATEALFSMTLTPEGDPVVNKAELLCEKFKIINDKLKKRGKRAGILVQATIGHGYKLAERSPFTHQVSLISGDLLYRVCPYDEGFRAYIKDAFRTVALAEPTSIMVDDDFRLFATSHRGCACPLHMAEISRRLGRKIEREELLSILNKKSEQSQRIMNVFYETQIDSLLGAARAMREGIDSVDPKIQGSFCLCGDPCEGARDIAKILAGEGNPTIVRLHNGNYTPAGAKNINSPMLRFATQRSVMGNEIDYFLAETDTCPQNRYSTSAANLHAHFTCSILEGAAGCKHWITKTNNFEPKSGEAYRKKLAKYARFYEVLSDIVKDLEWLGCRIPTVDSDFVPLVPIADYKNPSDFNGWPCCVLERLGLPMYYSAKDGGAAALSGGIDEYLSDEKIFGILSGTAFLAAENAESLVKRGFGEYIGVEVSPVPADMAPTREKIDDAVISLQMNLHKITPICDSVKERSTVISAIGGKDAINAKELFPGVTEYKNSLGGTVFTFAGTPKAAFLYTSGFSFLCKTRKDQLISFLRETNNLPVYYPDDAEVYLKAANTPDGKLFCAFTNLSLDDIEKVTLVADRKITSVTMLTPSGTWESVSFIEDADGVLTIDTPADTLHPVIMIVS